jgi:hypothetical protein
VGTIYEIACRSCGYTDTVDVGTGEEAHVGAAVCPTCREMRSIWRPVMQGFDAASIRGPAAPALCEECGTTLQPWRPQDALSTDTASGQLEDFEQMPPTGPCPACGGHVDARESGMWD